MDAMLLQSLSKIGLAQACKLSKATEHVRQRARAVAHSVAAGDTCPRFTGGCRPVRDSACEGVS